MNRRRFTRSETVALCLLLVALLVTAWIMMPRGASEQELAAVAAADSAYRAKADSLDALADSLRKQSLVRKTAVRDSIRHPRKKSAVRKTKEFTPAQRDYRGEQLSPSQQK